MKPSFKFCAYCTTVYNITPALLLTPMYTINRHCPMFTRAQYIEWGKRSHEKRDIHTKVPYPLAGFRLAFKFINIHLGIEVRYESRRTS